MFLRNTIRCLTAAFPNQPLATTQKSTIFHCGYRHLLRVRGAAAARRGGEDIAGRDDKRTAGQESGAPARNTIDAGAAIHAGGADWAARLARLPGVGAPARAAGGGARRSRAGPLEAQLS